MNKKFKKAAVGLATLAATTVLSVSLNQRTVSADALNQADGQKDTNNSTIDNTQIVKDKVAEAKQTIENAQTPEEAAKAQQVVVQSKVALTTLNALNSINSTSASTPDENPNDGSLAPANHPISAGDPSTYDADGLKPEAAQAVKNAGINPKTLTDEQKLALNRVDYSHKDETGATKMTYSDFQKIAETLVTKDSRYAIPYFNAKEIKNMPAAYTKDAQTGKIEHLDVWDSWPIQESKIGYVANWNGYQLAVAMMGMQGYNDNHIYLLYNKYGDNNLANWKNAGPIFGYNATDLLQQWSGSAIVNKDGSIQLFYTKVDTSDKTNNQKIASATLYLTIENGEVKISKIANDHVVFEGDGINYQTYEQWHKTNTGADNVAMRDAHVIEDEAGNRYLIFEASTGKQEYQGLDQIYNWNNYGGDDAYKIKSLFRLLANHDMESRASWANAAIGILRLDNNETNPQVAQVYKPLLTANMVSDEIERPDIVKLGDKYYLFAATRLNRGSNDDAWMAADKAVGDNVAMIGYVSESLTGGFKPLNESGVVLTASVPANWRTATYSYYAVPIQGQSDKVLITSYITNRNHVAGNDYESTWAPSFLLQINPDGTTKVLAKTTNQGDWIWDETSENDNMLGDETTAALPGEKNKPINWDLIGYGHNGSYGYKYDYDLGPALYNEDPKNSYDLGPALYNEDPKSNQDSTLPQDTKTPEKTTFKPESKKGAYPKRINKNNSAKKLPQTGESSQVAVLAGLSAIIASVMVALGLKRKEN